MFHSPPGRENKKFGKKEVASKSQPDIQIIEIELKLAKCPTQQKKVKIPGKNIRTKNRAHKIPGENVRTKNCEHKILQEKIKKKR